MIISELVEKNPVNWKTCNYPVLGIGEDNIIILFLAFQEGVVIREGKMKIYEVGYCSKTWEMDYFTILPIGVEVVLKNG